MEEQILERKIGKFDIKEKTEYNSFDNYLLERGSYQNISTIMGKALISPLLSVKNFEVYQINNCSVKIFKDDGSVYDYLSIHNDDKNEREITFKILNNKLY